MFDIKHCSSEFPPENNSSERLRQLQCTFLALGQNGSDVLSRDETPRMLLDNDSRPVVLLMDVPLFDLAVDLEFVLETQLLNRLIRKPKLQAQLLVRQLF